VRAEAPTTAQLIVATSVVALCLAACEVAAPTHGLLGPGAAIAGAGGAAYPEEPTLFVGGTSESGEAYVSLDTCPDVRIIHGSQNGYHIWTSVRACAVNPHKAVVFMHLEDAETDAWVKPGQIGLWVNLLPMVSTPPTGQTDPRPWFEYTGLPAFVKDPCAIHGRPLRVVAELQDKAGATAHAQGCLTGYLDDEWYSLDCVAPKRSAP